MCCRIIMKCFSFDPLCTVIGCDQDIFVAGPGRGWFKGAYEIQSPFLEWFQGKDRLMVHTIALVWLSHSLAEVTLYTKFVHVLFHDWLALSTLPYFTSCSVARVMTSYNAVVHFLNYDILFELPNRAPPYPYVIRSFGI